MLGGLIALRDATPPPGAAGGGPGQGAGTGGRRHGRLRLRVRRLRSGKLRLRVVGAGTREVRRVRFYARGKRIRTDRRRPFRATVSRRRQAKRGRTKVAARIVRKDGTRAKRVRRVHARRHR